MGNAIQNIGFAKDELAMTTAIPSGKIAIKFGNYAEFGLSRALDDPRSTINSQGSSDPDILGLYRRGFHHNLLPVSTQIADSGETSSVDPAEFE